MANFLDKILGRKRTTAPLSPSEIDTAPLQTDENKVDTAELEGRGDKKPSARRLDLPQFITGCGHSSGLQRDHNEDALFTLTTNLIADETQIPFGLYIIADGMGGHLHGEIASGVAARALAVEVIRKIFLSYLGMSDAHSEESVQEILQEGVQHAHREILSIAQGGGTTLTAALIMGDKLTITHVGDSRAYLIYPDGSREILTQDHSLVRRLEELGQITSSEAANHPQRNVLYRALGQGEPFEPDIATITFPRSAHLLICSDGLWGVVPDTEISRIVNSTRNPEMACQMLADAANNAGGPDNITMILVRLPD